MSWPELDGFRLHLLTEPDESGTGDLWLYCPDRRHFGVAYVAGPVYRRHPQSPDALWFVSVELAHPMSTPEGRVQNLRDLVDDLRQKWKLGHARP